MRLCMRVIEYVAVASDDAWRNNVDVAIARIVEEIEKIKVALLKDRIRKFWFKIAPLLKSKKSVSIPELAEFSGLALGTTRVYLKACEKIGLVKEFEEDE